MGSPVLVWTLERLQHHTIGAVAIEPFIGNRRARDVAAQTFELVALIGSTAYVGMQAKTVFVLDR